MGEGNVEVYSGSADQAEVKQGREYVGEEERDWLSGDAAVIGAVEGMWRDRRRRSTSC